MKKEEVRNYFNRVAVHWDEEMVRDNGMIKYILDYAKVCEGKDILDVACGTGVLIPDYLARKVRSVTAIDISEEMIRLAREKFKEEKVKLICGDVETEEFHQKFDCIVVYNAFPHFSEPEKLISCLISHLREGGTLTVAHGMSREKLEMHHSGSASKVSIGLMREEELARLFEPELTVTVKISDDSMYQVTGVLESRLL